MIQIKRNGNGDTRTASKDITYHDVFEASSEHAKSVQQALEHCASTIINIAKNHDITKFTAAKMFYDDMRKTLDDMVFFIMQILTTLFLQIEAKPKPASRS